MKLFVQRSCSISRCKLREQIIDQKLDSIVESEGKTVTQEQLLDRKLASLEEKDASMKNLIREYHDGLLMIEMSNREVLG